MVCWLSVVPLFGVVLCKLMSIGKGNSLPIAATLRGISVPSAGVAFQAYVAKRTPWSQRKKFE